MEDESIGNLEPDDLVRRGCIRVLERRHCVAHLTLEEHLLSGAYAHRTKGDIAENLERV